MSTALHIPTFTTADRLRKAREAACLEQSELAERMGVSRQTIINYERGHTTNYRRLVIKAWAAVTKVPEVWLTSGDTPSDEEEHPTIWMGVAA